MGSPSLPWLPIGLGSPLGFESPSGSRARVVFNPQQCLGTRWVLVAGFGGGSTNAASASNLPLCYPYVHCAKIHGNSAHPWIPWGVLHHGNFLSNQVLWYNKNTTNRSKVMNWTQANIPRSMPMNTNYHTPFPLVIEHEEGDDALTNRFPWLLLMITKTWEDLLLQTERKNGRPCFKFLVPLFWVPLWFIFIVVSLLSPGHNP